MKIALLNNTSIVLQNYQGKNNINSAVTSNKLGKYDYADIPPLYHYNNFHINNNLSFKGISTKRHKYFMKALHNKYFIKTSLRKYSNNVASKDTSLTSSAELLVNGVLKVLTEKDIKAGLGSINFVGVNEYSGKLIPELKKFNNKLYTKLLNKVLKHVDNPQYSREARSALSFLGDFSHADILLNSLEKDSPYLSNRNDDEIKNVARLMSKTDDIGKLFPYLNHQGLTPGFAALTVISEKGGAIEAEKLTDIVQDKINKRCSLNVMEVISLCKIATLKQADLVASFINPVHYKISYFHPDNKNTISWEAINSIGNIGNNSHTGELFKLLDSEIKKEIPRINERFRYDAPLTNIIVTSIGKISTNLDDAKKLLSLQKENSKILDKTCVDASVSNIVSK